MTTEVQPAPETGAGNDDVRADVMAAFSKLSSEDTEPDKAPETAAASDADAQPSERPRNERGQFTKADGAAEPVAEPVKPVPDADPAKDTVIQPSQVDDAPKGWRADAKAKWSTLDPSVRAEVSRRESEMDAAGARWSEEKRNYDQMLAPVRAQAQRAGVDEREGLNRLLSASEYLERDAPNAIRWLAKAYGVDLSKQPDNAQPQPQADPRVAQLSQDVSSVKDYIQRQEVNSARSEIDNFAKAPGHEHFEAVKERMGQLIASGQAKSLQDAYDTAIWTDASIRSQLIAAQTTTAQNERRAQEQARVEKAKAGAISSSGSPAGAAPIAKQTYDTAEEAARAAYRSLAAG